ncbi:MAG: hypothetical protein MI863_24530 [Desulfobacterales bacterium]|nr:hypothetical protein [Desulfobacterales bacterium]
MKNSLFIIFILIFTSACSHPIEKLAPDSELKGAVTPLKIIAIEKESKRATPRKIRIKAFVSVPHDIKKEQVRPTILMGLRILEHRFPGKDLFSVYLCPDGKKSMSCGYLYVARGEYADKEIRICYLIPSREQIEAYAEANKDMRPEKERVIVPRMMSKKDFYQAIEITSLYYDYYKVTLESAAALHATARELNLPEDLIANYKTHLLTYYGIERDSEIIR